MAVRISARPCANLVPAPRVFAQGRWAQGSWAQGYQHKVVSINSDLPKQLESRRVVSIVLYDKIVAGGEYMLS